MHRAATVCLVALALVGATATPSFAHTDFPTRQEALARPSVVVASGQTASQYKVGAPPIDTTYDLRDLTSTAYPFGTTYPLSFGKVTPGTRTVIEGGTVLGQAPTSWTWQQMKSTYDGAALLLFGQDHEVSYDLRADDVFDFIRPRPPSGDLNGARFLIDGCYATTVRDDAIENDNEMTGTIRNCVFDGINSGVSIGQNVKNPSAVTTIDDSTFIFRAMPNTNAPDGIGHAVLFKQMGGGQVVMHDDLVCYSETPIGSHRLLNWMPGTYSNVTIVLGPGFDGDGDGDLTDLDYPGTLPSGVTQTRDWSLCGSPQPPPTPAPPSVAGFSPTSGDVGTSVTITGSSFTGATAVGFNGTSAPFTLDSDTQITSAVPNGATSGPISVVTPGGTATSSSSFTVGEPPPITPPPSITEFSPTSGVVGTSVTITGSSFTGATAVGFNGTSAFFSVDTDTRITATVPSGATSGPISVVTPGGSASSASEFTVTQSPSIDAFSPDSGPPGTSVSITGSAFGGTTDVRFNGRAPRSRSTRTHGSRRPSPTARRAGRSRS
jgi:hypothetical protein